MPPEMTVTRAGSGDETTDAARRDVGAEAIPPGVSVIIPCYNGARFLPQAIDSVLAQSHPRVEVIVVDDGSTDETAEVVRGYSGRVRYLYQDNAGLSAARNAGIRAATHDFVSFLDADDCFHPHMIETMCKTLESLSPDYALVGCHADWIDENGDGLVRRLHVVPTCREVRAKDLILMSRFPCTVLVGRAALTECGLFDPALKSSEDRDMWIRIATRHRLFLLPDRLVEIRRHSHNMSKNAARQSRSIRAVLRKAYLSRAISRWNLPLWLQAGSIYFFQSALMYAEAGDRIAAAARLIGSVGLWPCFPKSSEIDQPPFFRIRRLARLFLEAGAGLLGYTGELRSQASSTSGGQPR